MKTNWLRATRKRLCLICGKPDWCLIAADKSAAICQRIESDKRAGQAGWLHKLGDGYHLQHPLDRTKPLLPKRQRKQRNWPALALQHFNALSDEGRAHLSKQLGISTATLEALQVGWSPTIPGSTWPMRDAAGKCVGIRTRDIDHQKKAISGSDGNGLFFIPAKLSNGYLIICEGPTDAASLIDCGFGSTVGRPSCSGGNRHIVELLKRLQPSAVLLIPDSDDAGLAGFSLLANDILQSGAIPFSRLGSITPANGVNDIRDWAKKDREHLAGRVAAKLKNTKQRAEASNE